MKFGVGELDRRPVSHQGSPNASLTTSTALMTQAPMDGNSASTSVFPTSRLAYDCYAPKDLNRRRDMRTGRRYALVALVWDFDSVMRQRVARFVCAANPVNEPRH